MNIAEYYKKGDTILGISKILFNELRENYILRKISEVCNTTSGGTPKRGNAEYYNGKIPWLKSGELNDSFITNCEEYISDIGLKNSSAKLLPKETLLVAMYGATAGKTGILTFDATTNQAVCALFPKETLLRDYLYWFLRQHRLDFIIQSKGGAQPNISQKVIKATEIPIPPKNIQQKVINFLNEINKNGEIPQNDLLSNNSFKSISKYFLIRNSNSNFEEIINTQKQLISQLKQAILKEAIQGKLTQEWREQNPNVEPASELLERIKAEKEQLIKDKKIRKEKLLPPITENEIPFEVPENWIWCRLGEIAINRDELRKPISQKEREQRAKIYDYYGASGCIDKIDDFTHNGSFLLIGEDGSNLRLRATPIAFQVSGKFWVNNHAHTITFLDSITQSYICDHINGIDLKPYITGGFQPKLNQRNLNEIMISLPPLEEQKAIVEKVETSMQKCNALDLEITKSEQHANMLMQSVLKEAFESKTEKKEEYAKA